MEQIFGVLQSPWVIVPHPARTWSSETMCKVLISCVIIHNTVVKDDHDDSLHDQRWLLHGELVERSVGQQH
jgi:hypothetical protein